MAIINKDKKEMRRQILLRRNTLSPDWVNSQSALIVGFLTNWEPFLQAKNVMLYLAMPGEPDIDDLILFALENGKQVSVPLLTEKFGYMESAAITGLQDLKTGKLNLRVPDPEKITIVDPGSLDLILVPAVTFDLNGNRLGMGAGYYDRFLTQASKACTLGVAWSFQIVPFVAAEEHDVPVQYVITEEKITICSKGKM
jgi:5-formyltetrahydrofolate cyclo-ligase